jgi:hypothetical protein
LLNNVFKVHTVWPPPLLVKNLVKIENII